MDAKSLLFKLDGHKVVPVDNVFDWCEWMDAGNLGVDYSTYGGIGIATIFLGLPAPRVGDGPPLLFETALVRGNRPGVCVERYATWDEAERGHAKWTKAVREGRATPKAASLN